MRRKWIKSLAAILSGNAIYYLLVPYLPRFARHHIFQIDFGLLLDGCLCVLMFALINWLDRR